MRYHFTAEATCQNIEINQSTVDIPEGFCPYAPTTAVLIKGKEVEFSII